MKKIELLLCLCPSVFLLSSCIDKSKDLYDPVLTEKISAINHAQNILGKIDVEQDWKSSTSYEIVVTADAPLDNIVKVQILSDAPFFNEDARVLNEAPATNGASVTLQYEAPNTVQRLVAACIDKHGIYFIKGFYVNQSTVNFSNAVASSRMGTRAETVADDDFPNPANLVLAANKSCLSYNAMRTIKAGEGETTNNIGIWLDQGWQNERLWRMNDQGSTTTWKVQNQTIIKNIGPIDEQDNIELTDIFNNYLGAKTASGKKKDNLQTIRDSELFTLGHNELTSDGVNPITVIPVLMISSEISSCHLYYYYYNPSVTVGMTSEEEVQFLKDLPKYKAIQCHHTKSKTSGSGFFNIHQYLLTYFGDGEPVDGQQAQSIIFPKGYKVGFMLRKLKTNSNDCYNNYVGRSYTAVNNGCVYGDGRLNTEINQLAGHFGSSVTFYSMHTDDPRIAVFGANGKTFMTFEDGADCNFCDMIVQVTGVERTDESHNPEPQAYTMVFEDHVMADYDMNDVVIKVRRIDATHAKVSIVACGAYDELYLRGLNGNILNGHTEIHAMFGVETNQFVNTKAGMPMHEPVEEVFNIPANAPLESLLQTIYLYDKTTDSNIMLAEKGDAPRAIVVPEDFEYPSEGVCIKTAYPNFINWVQNASVDTDWYLYPAADKVFGK